jgi:hypothetical protein
MCVTGTPEGFFTPLEAQPATSAAIAAPQTGMPKLVSNRFIIYQLVHGPTLLRRQGYCICSTIH